MDNILRVALYIRVSTEEQAQHGYSLQAQEDALLRFSEEKGYKIVGIYRDEGNSARKPALRRPVMLGLLEDVKDRKVDRILFVKLDRWFRNVREYHEVQAILDRHGVTWQATMEDYNTATADGRLKVNIMLSVAENEADRDSERIKFVFDSKLQRREVYFPPQNVPWGYAIQEIDGVKRLVKDPDAEEAVDAFFSTALSYGVRRAAVEMTDRFGIERNYSVWAKTAKKEIYTGVHRGVENFCPAYITKQDHEKLMDTSRTVRKAQHNRVYMFSGLIKCPQCGKILAGKNNRKRSDKEYMYYRCTGYLNGTCTFSSQVSELVIEKYLLENIRKQMEDFVLSAEVEGKEKKVKVKKNNAAKLHEKLRRVNVAYYAGNIDDEEYLSKTRKLKDQIEAEKKVEQEEEKPADLSAMKDMLSADFESIYETLNKEDRRRMWRSIIRSITMKGVGTVADIDFAT